MPKTIKTIIYFGIAFGSFRMLIGGVSALYLLANGVSLQDLGYLKSFQFALSFCLDIPLSYFADRYSRKFSTILGIWFAAFWLLLTALSTNLIGYFIAEALNAISLCLFGGAYISYLVDIKNKHFSDIQTQDILAFDNKYNAYGMAICALIGSAFVHPSSSLIWYIASALLMITAIGAQIYLPKDNSTHKNNKTPALLLLQKHKTEIIQQLKHTQIALALLVVASLLVYFQIIVQLWQPFIDTIYDANTGFIYGAIFIIVCIAQALSSDFIHSKKIIQVHKNNIVFALLLSSLILMGTALALHKNIHSYFIISLAVFSLFIAFFSTKFLMISAHAFFHDIINEKYRSSFDSLAMFLSRFVLIIIFPLMTYFIQSFSYYILVLFLLMIFIIYTIVNTKLKKLCQP